MAVNLYIHYPARGGGGSGGDERSGTIALDALDQGAAISFSTTFSSNNYRVVTAIRNTTDPIEELQFLQPLITAKSASGFTVTLSAPVATDNYSIDYIALEDS